MERIPNTSDETENLEQPLVLAKELEKPVLTILDGEIEKPQALESELAVAEKIEKFKSDIKPVSDKSIVSKSSTIIQSTQYITASAEHENRKNKSRGFVETLKDQGYLLGMRLKGVEDPKAVLDFVHYLEENAVSYDYKTVETKYIDLWIEEQNLQQAGYEIWDRSSSDNEVTLKAKKSSPYKIEMKWLPLVARFLDSKNDPVQVFELMKTLGYEIDIYDIYYDFEDLKKFMGNAHVPILLEKLKKMQLMGVQTRKLLDTKYNFTLLIDLAEKDATSHVLDEKALHNIVAVSSIMPALSVKEIGEWALVTDNIDVMNLVNLMKKQCFQSSESGLYYFKTIKEAGVAKEIVDLVNSGHALKEFGITDEYFSDWTKLKEISSTIQSIKSDPAFYNFLFETSSTAGVVPTLNKNELEELKQIYSSYKHSDILDGIQIVKKYGENHDDEWNWKDTKGMIWAISQKETSRMISDPNFEKLLSAMHRAGYKVSHHDMFGTSSLIQSYLNKNLQSKLDQEENIALIKHLDFFQSQNWSDDTIDGLLSIPGAFESIKNIERGFGYKYDKHSDFQRLLKLLNDQSLMNKIFQPEVIDFYNRIEPVIELQPHASSSEAIMNAETIASYDPSLYPVLETVIREWNYSGVPLVEKDILEKLRDNPAIIQAALKLKAMGISIRPLDELSLISSIVENDALSVIEHYKDLPRVTGFIMRNVESVAKIPREKIPAYVEIFQKIDDSPSQEIQRLKESLLNQLLQSEHPAEDYREIEAIFIRNNIPAVGKIFGVFEALHDSENLNSKISGKYVSPVLKGLASTKSQYFTIYKDLLNIHIKSGNRSLRDYAKVLQSGSQLLDKCETEGFTKLEAQEKEQLQYFLGKLETLLSKSELDTADEAFVAADSREIQDRIEHIRESMKVATDQTIIQRISDMYLKPVRISSLEDLLEKMNSSKIDADKRARALVSELSDTNATIALRAGDFLKGVDENFIANIFQNGSVAKEFLGSSSDSDLTPLDTDVSMIMPDQDENFEKAIRTSLAKDYGDILFALRDRGQFQRTERDKKIKVREDKLELFKTTNDQHYGIRTGFPSTEIDFIIVRESVESNSKQLQDLFFEISKNGFYIPVTDETGKVIYTPEMYDELRKSFAGIDRYEGEELKVMRLQTEQKAYEEVARIRESTRETSKHTEKILGVIRKTLNEAVGGLGVSLRPKYDTSIIGAELIDTGSSGRHTNMPGDFDFDFSLKLDAADFERSSDIAQAIKAMMVMEKDDSSAQENGYYQLRAKGVTEISGIHFEQPIDIDIGFARKSDLGIYGSHDAVRDKLGHIRTTLGEEVYEDVVSNIIFAKKILKDGTAYKKQDHGGLGGIGVENWILANGGNIEEAFKSFRNAAYANGKRLPYEEFKKKYRIIDPGINIKFLKHDNFIEILKPDGYKAMLDVIDKHLK